MGKINRREWKRECKETRRQCKVLTEKRRDARDELKRRRMRCKPKY